ncbi:MAG: OST-HTH/LOTUS domain-containing protein [Pseudomonadota bacterium]
MKIPVELEDIKNEVQRKIGRNLLLYQQIEHIIKWLVANKRIDGYISDIHSVRNQQKEKIANKPLGCAIGQYINSHQSISDFNNEAGQTELKEMYVTFSCCHGDCDTTRVKERNEALKSLVDERNEFIHHLLPRLNPMSMDSWTELEQYLDRQRDKVLPELTQLQSEMNGIRESRKEMVEFINSERGIKLFELFLFRPEGHLVSILYYEASKALQNNGWILLSSAGQLIQKAVPGEKGKLIKKYGYSTLKALVLATDLFEIFEEPTAKGGLRVFYRLKPEEALQ